MLAGLRDGGDCRRQHLRRAARHLIGPPQKSRRDIAVHVAHDGLVHLDLIVAPNLCAMRFEARPIDVVVVAANQS